MNGEYISMSGRRKTVRISEAEWHIMNVLWDACPKKNGVGLSLGEIVQRMPSSMSWTNTTIRTLIIRLADKGVVKIDKTTGVYKYMPALDKSQCVEEEIDMFVARVCDNSPYQLVASLVRKGKLNEREKKEIIDILNEIH